MQIAFFTDTPRIGGAERYLADLAAGAAEAGHGVTVLAPERSLLEFVGACAPQVRLVQAGRASTVPSLPAHAGTLAVSLPELRRALASSGADLLHVSNGGYPGSDLCRLAPLAARLAAIPRRVLTVHAMPAPRHASRFPLAQAAIDRAVWAAVDVVLGATTAVGDGLRELRAMPAELYARIPYGVAEPSGKEEREALRARLVPGGQPLLAGMVSATGDLEKGHGVFVDALARAGPDIRAVIVGYHPGPPFLDRIEELGLDARVAVEGHVAAAGPYLHAIDLLVVPSTAHESLPLVVLEAMAAGKPVLASRLAGIPEAVEDGETGRLFTPGSVDELAALLREASRNRPGMARMGAAGRARWSERYTVAEMRASTLRLYEELGL